MSYKHIVVIVIVSGTIFLVLIFNTISEVMAVILGAVAIAILVAGLVIERAYHRPDRFVEQLGEADILNRMWFPLQDELTDVVRTGGRVTESSSAWTAAPRLSKKETPTSFFREMEQYVRRRELVASFAASDLATEDSRQQLEAGQQSLLFMAQELHKEVNKAIEAIPGASAVRRTRSARPRPSYQRPQATATRPSPASSAETRQSTPVSRSAQARTATPARTIRERPAPMRIADTPMTSERAVPTPVRWEPEPPTAPSAPRPPSRPAPTPLRITDAPKPPEPTVTPPAPRESEPTPVPSVPPAPSPVTASLPESVAAVPAPSVPEPAATPSEVQLDVASVCEDLFDPNRMSYETNRLFDDRYKDATVRWKGTARRANPYSYDFTFGDGGGTKAEFDVYEVKEQYGSRTVRAFVQLPVEDADDIGARIGEDVHFEGRLISCEGSARRLYVADARMVD